MMIADHPPAGPAPVTKQVNRTGSPYPCLPEASTKLLTSSSVNTPCTSGSSQVANGVPVQVNSITSINSTFANDDFHGFLNSL